MRKSITKIICVATAAISAIGVCFAAGCGGNRWQGVSVKDDSYKEVTSNGGFLVETGKYVYFVNGVESNTADNTFGSVVKGSIQRISKQNISERKYAETETVVPAIAYSADSNAGIYIYDDYIYFATPSTSLNSDGVVQNSKIEFKRATLDGTQTMDDYFYRSASSSIDYRYVQVDGTVYLMYALSETLYEESSAVTNIHSVNTSNGTDTVLAYNVTDYNFDTQDPTNPYVFYTMAVTDNLGSSNSVTESYNQLYVARADSAKSLKEYDFSYIEDYDAENKPVYINLGSYVLDGIGVVEYGSETDNRRNQFNYNYGNMDGYSINYTGYTYKPVSYVDGVLQLNATQNGDTNSILSRINVSELDKDGDGKTDAAWDAINANKTLKDNEHLILNVSDSTEYIFVNINGSEKVMYAGTNGIEIGELIDGEVKNSYPITSNGKPSAFLAVREETTAAESGTGTAKHLYVYYSLTGGNGYTVYRIAIDGSIDAYETNKLPYEDVYTYSEVRVLDIDCVSSWYKPEFVDNQILFASETTGMTSYNYIMACDLRADDGNILSNAQLNDYTEKFNAVFDKIDEYDEQKNSAGTDAYQYLSNALKYLFYTGDREYLGELIQAYVDIQGKSEEYMYSTQSAAIYKDFADAKGDWADYADDVKKVNGQDVHANSIEYYYSVVGKMSETDAENRITSLKNSYMQAYPTDDSTWWEGLSLVAKVFFIIGMCVAGALVIFGIVFLVIFLVKKNKEGDDEEEKGNKIDITDDKNIDVYSNEEK